jgi:hypothetical protein
MDTTKILQQAYNRTHWNTFLHDIFADGYEAMINPFQENANIAIAKSASRLGEIKLHSGEIIAVYDVELQDSIHIAQNKVAIRNLLKQSWKYYDGAFIASYKKTENDWRFSFLSETKEWNEDGNYEKVQTQAKRYTYLLGENQSCRTAVERFNLLARDEKTLSNIIKAFSVETLTKQFYGELFDWYQWAIDGKTGVTFPNNVATADDDREQIDTKIIRLITRLMFVWFIKQSDLIPEKIFDIRKVKNILKDFDPLSHTSGNYYNAILQNLFFATLNRAINDEDGNLRGFAKSSTKDVKTLFRYAELFCISESEVINLFSEVPFLNGGLFECLDKTKTIDGVEKAYNYDGFSRNDKTFADGRYRNRAFVPNILFFEQEKGLLSILKRYNFTIEENTPQEQQVALDPELLGKVFENLLGAYNPETKETARNQSGSFYTPREIVDYMVDEALIAYLGDAKTIRTLFQEENLPEELRSNPDERNRICNKLKEVKILDPACGSGAFPMGILNRTVEILQKLSGKNDENSIYNEKLQIIENCIFGVDIQNIATQISKLRFFISLICHCRKELDKPNFGIPTLPNLETKFVSANSLIGIKQQDSGVLDLNDEKLKQMRDELQEIRHDHFKAKSSNEKISLRKKDEKLRSEIEQYILSQNEGGDLEKITNWEKDIEALREELKPYLQSNMVDETSHYKQTSLFEQEVPSSLFQRDTNEPKRKELLGRIKVIETQIKKENDKQKLPEFENAIRQLAAWNPYDQNGVSPFFDPEWMFGIKDGFDIVIGNPPYIQLQKSLEDGTNRKYGDLYKDCDYETFERTGDIYCLFYERGVNLLRQHGVLCYITSNKWMRAGYGKSTRNFFSTKANPKLLVDFAGVKMFESATVDTNILLLAKEPNQRQTVCAVTSKNNKDGVKNLSVFVQQHATTNNFGSENSWVILSPTEKRIKEKIESVGVPLKDWDINIYRGVLTGCNEAFIISDSKRQEILNNCESEVERSRTDALIRPILRGRDIKRYGYEWDRWLIGTFPSRKYEIEDYPAVKNHLLSFGKDILNSNCYEWVGENYLNEWCLKRLQQTGEDIIIGNRKIVIPKHTKSRKQTGGKWFETQDSISYWEDFLKPKIVWKRVGSILRFSYDNNGSMALDSTCFATGSYIKYLVAILNSKMGHYLLKNAPKTGTGDLLISVQAVEPIKVPIPSEGTNKDLTNLINKQLISFSNVIDSQINHKVYDIYGLSNEEIEFVENEVDKL